MISNKKIAQQFNQLASIMELHGESHFKISSYQKAYQVLRSIDRPLAELTSAELKELPGVGNAIADKIIEYISTGKLKTYQRYAEKTPDGIIEMLQIRGLGPKKIKTLTSELQVDNPADLLQACLDNRLLAVKGFGEKSQSDILSKLNYYLESKGSYLYATILPIIDELLYQIGEVAPGIVVDVVGEAGRKMEVVSQIDLLADMPLDAEIATIFDHEADGSMSFRSIPISWRCIESDDTRKKESVISTASESFLDSLPKADESVYEAIYQYIPQECREWPIPLDQVSEFANKLVAKNDLKGLIHCHTTYSDGMHTLGDMAQHAASLGYTYMVVTDHSKAAFYANGLKEERLYQQGLEIDEINTSQDSIYVYKGLECDILANGDLDMTLESLATLDLVIASIHTVLNMDRDKATQRLIKAIENPYTDMLGHPTGRLLLARTGYDIDHEKVIDACAANQVAIEINANPKRLDMDWRWIPYAVKKGVWISINPDAHSKDGMVDNAYGIITARKGHLFKENCLNVLDREYFEKWIQRK